MILWLNQNILRLRYQAQQSLGCGLLIVKVAVADSADVGGAVETTRTL